MSTADRDEPDAILDPEAEAELLAVLEAAWRPGTLDPARHERLLELALEDPLAPPTAEELVEAERLRTALEQGHPHADAELLRGLGAAFGSGSTTTPNEPELPRALDNPPRSNVIYRAFGVAGLALAAAAVTLLFVRSPERTPTTAPTAAALVEPRSTAPLFSERFDTQTTTARMDLIASARGRDLRSNRFAAWGVP